MNHIEREAYYRACICPTCKGQLTHMPEAPGSEEGRYCIVCKASWGWWRQHRGGARVIPYGEPSWWMKAQDYWKYLNT